MLKIICFDAFHNKKHFESELLPYSHTPPLVSMKVKDYRKHPLLVNIKKKKKKNTEACSSVALAGFALPICPGFEPSRVRLSPLRCLTCLLGLQDV
jgi:hypothetical protein